MYKKVLIVDDESEYRLIVKDFLQDNFMVSVYEAVDGADAMFKLRNDEFSVVITDLAMPKLSGIDLLRFIQANIKKPSQTHVIILSGSIDAAVVENINQKSGRVKAFLKPFDTSELFKELSPHLTAKRQDQNSA